MYSFISGERPVTFYAIKSAKLYLAVLGMFIVMLLVNTVATAQAFEDFIEETRDDTVVVIDYVSSDFQPNTLFDAIELDTHAPAGRVYELKAGGFYWFTRNTTIDRPTVIVGSENSRLVQSDSDLSPPILTGTMQDGQSQNGDFFLYAADLTIKNAMLVTGATNGDQGWAFLTEAGPNNAITLENVLMEHNNWVFIRSNEYDNNSIHISDSYFVNMSGEACHRNGGVYDNVSNNTNEIIVENTTHIMAQGMLYRFRSNHFGKAFFNQNTFVNVSGQVFSSFGYHTNLTVTNNLFVNSNVQGYFPGLDGPDDHNNEADQDNLPHGIINVNHLPEDHSSFDDYDDVDRKILVYNNGVFWDERLDQIVPWLNSEEARGRNDWVTQMITMNSRTQEIFNDNDRYPLMQEGNWIMGGDPNFVDPSDLMTDQVDELITWSQQTLAETDYTLPKWRQQGNETQRGGDDGNFTIPDWPIPVNLAYSNTYYLSAGIGGYPLGDLNWFPSQRAQWEANKEGIHAELAFLLHGNQEPPSSPPVATTPTIPTSPENGLISPQHEAQNVTIPVAMSWEPVTGASSYFIEISKTASFDTTLTVKNFAGQNFTFHEAEDETTYFWRVRAQVGETLSQWTNYYSFTTELRPPETPVWAPKDGTENVDPRTTLVWQASVRATSYNLQLGTSPEFDALLINEKNLEEPNFDVSLGTGGTYYWRVQAVNASGSSEWSETLSFTTKLVASIGNDELPKEFGLSQNYPNPFNPVTVIGYQLPVSSDVRLEVFDLLGRRVSVLMSGQQAAGHYEVTFDANRLSNGVYIYRLQAGDFIKTRQMLLMK